MTVCNSLRKERMEICLIINLTLLELIISDRDSWNETGNTKLIAILFRR